MAEVIVEEEAMEQEVVREEVQEEVITKEVGMVNAVGLVEVEVFCGKALEGPSRGSSGQGGPEHTFLAAPSPLLLLLFKFVAVSHWSFLCFLCFWSSGNWCDGNWFALGFLSSLGCRRMLGDVRGNGCRH